jgi:succinate dehydrogenase / fumarate reductase, flavoprotein subunit
MAYRAGVPLMDMEFVQFHPTTLRDSGILISEAARGEGAYLMNTLGERFMERYNPKAMELATRAEVSFAMQTEIDEERGVDGCVLLDLRHLGKPKILERLPQIRQLSIDFAGIDPIESPIPVRPGAHYSMGGIESSVWGETRLPGFFAAGECACVSVHGANRLGGNSLLETIVFGRRSGTRASQYVRSVSILDSPPPHIKREKDRINALLERTKGERIGPIRDELGTVMNQNMGIFRTPDGMRKTIEKIRELKARYQEVVIQDKGSVFNTELVNVLELESLLDLTEVIVTGAIAREESRGSHFRRDHPQRDDTQWLRHTLAFFTSDGPRMDYKPVTITRHTPK